MMRTIVKREILDQLSSLKFLSVMAVCSVLIVLSIYTGAANYVSDLKEYETTRALAQSELTKYATYADIGIHGVKVPKKPSALSIISSGVQGVSSKFVTVHTATRPELGPSKFSENPIFAIFGNLDLTFVVKVVLSLLVIILTYDSISGEKELGTLKLMLSNPIPRVKVILAKMLGLLVCLSMAILPAVVVGLLIVSIVFKVHFTEEQWVRLGLIFGVYGLYLLLIFALGMFISARTSRSSLSLLFLLLCWIIFVTIIPRAAVILAGHLRPVPPYSEILSKMEANQRQRTQEYMVRMFKLGTELMKSGRHGKEGMEAFQQRMEELQEEMQAKIEQDNAKILEEYERKRDNLTQLAVNLSRVSPASAMTYAVMRLAGTGLQSQKRFLSDIAIYRKELQQYISECGGFMKSYSEMMRKMMEGETLGPAGLDLSGLPVFREHNEGLVESVYHVLPDVVLLVFGAVVLLSLAFVSFVRCEI